MRQIGRRRFFMEYQIRQAVADDVAGITRLVQSFVEHSRYGSLEALMGVDVERLSEFVAGVLERGVCFVADVSDAPHWQQGEAQPLVAFIGLVTFAHPFSGKLIAEELAWWVEPDYRKSTVGYRLLTAALAWARSSHCAMIRCSAPFGSDVGEFYERRGFTPIDSTYVKSLT